MKIVVFKFNNLGDNVIFVPVVQALRARFPDWHITLLTAPREMELYSGRGAPQRMLLSPKQRFEKSYRRPWRLAYWLLRVRRERPDACLLPYDQGTVSHVVAKHSGARVRVGGNLEHIRTRHSLTHEVAMPADGALATWNWDMGRVLVEALGHGGDWPDHPPPPDLAHLVSSDAPRKHRRRIIVHAGSSRPLNRWPEAKFLDVARNLARDHEVVWIVRPEVRASPPPGMRTEQPKSLGAFATVLASADLFVGNNSGPMHLANALGLAGVVITGPSAFGWDPYWHRERWRVLRPVGLACAPCERPNKETLLCANRASPMACFSAWTPDAVAAQCRALLQGGHGVPA
jgi:ADP-heptose:LPS heptosyltransferase